MKTYLTILLLLFGIQQKPTFDLKADLKRIMPNCIAMNMAYRSMEPNNNCGSSGHTHL